MFIFLTHFRALLQLFSTMEIIKWKELIKDYEEELKFGLMIADVFSEYSEEGIKRWTDLKLRVSEHVYIIIL